MLSPNLDFKLLDDLMLVRPEQIPSILPRLEGHVADALGPAMEFAFSRTSELPPLDQLFPSPLSNAIARSFRDPELAKTSSIEPREMELALPPADRVTNVFWMALRRRFVNAAKASGFDDSTAKGLVSAFIEMVANVGEHSGAPETALAGYRWSLGSFEFVIADRGQGVLASLRTNRDYARVSDHGQALQVALSSGESRYGHLTGRGNGFDSVFNSLAQLTGTLRFRSGDHSLEMDGSAPTLIRASVRQRAPYQGMFISIVCRP